MLNSINIYHDDVLSLYKNIVRVSSCSYDKAGVDEVCDIIYDFGKKFNFDVEKTMNEKAGNEVVLTLNKNAEGPVTVFLAHMDTVHEKGTFENMLIEKEGKFFGPGVLDCKGGIAVALLTCLSLKDYGYSCPLRIVLVCDEEISMVLSGEKGVNFIKENVKDASVVFTCESGNRNKIVVGRKGAARYRVTLTGKAAHAGSDYDKGISAIKAACYIIPEIEKHSDINGITFNCGLISGGKAPNIVPEKCEFVVDVRYKNQEEMEESERILYKALKSAPEGITVKTEQISKRIPMEATENNIKLFERVKKISNELSYEDFTSWVSGGASDAAFSTAMGIPTLCGMGMAGKSQHTLNEEAEKASLRDRSHILAETTISLLKESL